jgi:hypothetical protein
MPLTLASCGRSRAMISSADPAAADRRSPARDVRVLRDDVGDRLLQTGHFGEGDILRRLGQTGDAAGILLREEAFRHLDIEIAGRQDREDEGGEGDAAVSQHGVQSLGVERERAIEKCFADPVQPSVLAVLVIAQEQRGHHRR